MAGAGARQLSLSLFSATNQSLILLPSAGDFPPHNWGIESKSTMKKYFVYARGNVSAIVQKWREANPNHYFSAVAMSEDNGTMVLTTNFPEKTLSLLEGMIRWEGTPE